MMHDWFYPFAMVAVIVYSCSCWGLIDFYYRRCARRPRRGRQPTVFAVTDMNRGAYIARYNHVHSELSRYRDLSWKISALCWGIYYGLWLVGVTHEPNYFSISKTAAVIGLILTPVLATVFLLNCEYLAHRLRIQRLRIERKFRLDTRVAHTVRSIDLRRFPFWFSVSVFLLAIWAPAIAMISGCITRNNGSISPSVKYESVIRGVLS